jgi:hypothetical protein
MDDGGWPPMGLPCATVYSIYIGTDDRGSFPWLLWGDEALPPADVHWRLFARTKDPEIASQLMQQAHEECYGPPSRKAATPGAAARRPLL